jgi:hypothetical protein
MQGYTKFRGDKALVVHVYHIAILNGGPIERICSLNSFEFPLNHHFVWLNHVKSL